MTSKEETIRMPSKPLFPKRKLALAVRAERDETVTDGFNDTDSLISVGPCLSLFAKTRPKQVDNDDIEVYNDPELDTGLICMTLNICPEKKVNNKKWKTYSNEQQKAILTRLENAFRRQTPSVTLNMLTFEICPTLKNVHIHALYNAPNFFRHEIDTYWLSKFDLPGWRTIITEPCHNRDAWLTYISKAQV